jgi:hypothetical protein
MIRFLAAIAVFKIIVAAVSLVAAQAGAQTPDTPRPAFDLTGAEVEAAGRACFGPTGRPVVCRRPVVLR